MVSKAGSEPDSRPPEFRVALGPSRVVGFLGADLAETPGWEENPTDGTWSDNLWEGGGEMLGEPVCCVEPQASAQAQLPLLCGHI